MLPVQELFPVARFEYHIEAPLGRRRVDLLCVPRSGRGAWIAVELKVRDWWHAVWQANINFQVAEQSYIAVWHEYVHLPAKKMDIFKEYGLGLIEVYADKAIIIQKSKDTINRPARTLQQSRSMFDRTHNAEAAHGR